MKEIKEIIQSSNPKNPNSDKMKGWEIAEFEKCLEKVIYTNKIQRKDFKEEGIYPIVSQEKDFINGYWDNEDDIFRVDKPVVIFGDHTQVIKFVDFDFVLGADGVKILKPNDKIDPKYFYYFLQNIELGSLGYARHYRLLKEINVAFPKSLPEQQRIVSILDECFSAIAKAKANAEQNLKNTKEVFESYLQGVFEKKGDGWEEKKLIDVCEIKPQKKEARDKLTETDLVTFLPMEDLGVLNKEIVGIKERQLKDVAGSYTYFTDNDVLLAKITPCFENGKIGIARNLINGVGFGSSEYIVFRTQGSIEPDYLYYFLSRNQIREEGRKYMSGAVGHKRVSKDWIENYLISFPKSLKEQQTIVRQLDALRAETQKLEAVYQKKLDDLEELKKSVLKRAFAGEL